MAADRGPLSTPSSSLFDVRDRKGDELFALAADAVRKEFEPLGYSVYVSTNVHSMTVTEQGYVGGGEHDFHIKVRAIPGE